MAGEHHNNLFDRIEEAGARDLVEAKTIESLIKVGVLSENELESFIEGAHAAGEDMVTYACSIKPITALQIAEVRASIHGVKAEPLRPAFDDKTVHLLDLLIATAVQEQASAIAVEAARGSGKIQFLVGTKREKVFGSVQQQNIAKIGACIKALAGMETGSKAVARGRLTRSVFGVDTELDVIWSTAADSETVVLRFLVAPVQSPAPVVPEPAVADAAAAIADVIPETAAEIEPTPPPAEPESSPDPMSPAEPDTVLPPIFALAQPESADPEPERERERERELTVAAATGAILDDSFEAEMLAWVELRGSEQVRAMMARGYDVTGLYVSERAAAEFPGFTPVNIDDDRFETSERTNPSRPAFTLMTRAEALVAKTAGSSFYHTSVVQITKNALDDEGHRELGHGEAVIVQGYLRSSSTVLVQPVDVKEALGRFTRRWAMMQEAGVPTLEIFADAISEEPSLRFRAMLEQIHLQLGERVPLSDALDLFPDEFPAHYRSMIRAGEQADGLARVINELAAEYR